MSPVTLLDETSQFTKAKPESFGGISVRGIVVILLTLTACYACVLKIEMSESFKFILFGAMTYYFGQNHGLPTPTSLPASK